MDPAIARELAALREEIEALRGPTTGAAASGDAPPADDNPLGAVIATLRCALKHTQASLTAHPLAGAAAALALGLLIGRAAKSR